MHVDASSASDFVNRGALIRQAAQGHRAERHFGANVLNRSDQTRAFNFRSFLDRISLSVEARAAKFRTITSDPLTSATPKGSTTPTPTLPPVNPHAALTDSVDPPTYTKPKPTTSPGSVIQPAEPEVVVGKPDVKATAEVLGSSAVASTPAPASEGAETVLPASVLREQLFSAFGASVGDAAFNAELDFDGDGILGLGDLNHLSFHDSARDTVEVLAGEHDLVSDALGSDAKPEPTLPPVVIQPTEGIEPTILDGKPDVHATHDVVGSAAVASTPAPKPEPAATVLPTSVVQEHLLSAFGAQEGDAAYNAELDFDGDGVIGLNDLNQLFFNSN